MQKPLTNILLTLESDELNTIKLSLIHIFRLHSYNLSRACVESDIENSTFYGRLILKALIRALKSKERVFFFCM